MSITSDDSRHRFRPLTREDLDAVEAKISEQKKAKEQSKTDEEEVETCSDVEGYSDPNLEAGLPLPLWLQNSFPEELTSTPIVDIDSYYSNKRTFVVINQNQDIYRFNSTKSLWLFSPFHQIRRVAIFIYVYPKFGVIMLCVIIINCLLMGVRNNPNEEASELLFMAVYTFEFAVKVISLGFIFGPFSYLRDRWNWIDFFVLLMEYLPMVMDMSCLRAVRVLRALKTFNNIEGVKTIIRAVIECATNLWDVVILTFFTLWILALIGLQLYMGVLRQKCIRTLSLESLRNMTENEVQEYREDPSNWYVREGEEDTDPLLCGNSTWTTQCPENYTCYTNYGANPNFGYTSFDTFGWALLAAFRIMMEDSWETLYQQIIRALGPWHVLYFILVLFLGSQYLLNLILAIVDISFSELQHKAQQEAEAEVEILKILEMEKERAKQTDTQMNNGNNSSPVPNNDDVHNINNEFPLAEGSNQEGGRQEYTSTDARSLPDHELHEDELSQGSSKNEKKTWTDRFQDSFLQCINTWCVWDCCECWKKFQKVLSIFVYDAFVEVFIALCIIINTVFLAMHHHGIDQESYDFLEKGNYIFAVIFATEVVVKMVAISPKNFFQDKWNIFEFVVALLSIIDALLDMISVLPIMRSLRLLRIFKLARSWPTLNLLMTTMANCLMSLGSLCFILIVIIFIFTVMGMEMFGDSYETNKHKFPHGEVPRWHFNDFSHSFMIVFSVLCGEWIASMWNCMLVSGYTCVPFFLAAVIIANMLFFSLLIAILMGSLSSSSMGEVPDDAEITEAINRFKRLGAFLMRCFRRLTKSSAIVHPSTNDLACIEDSSSSIRNRGSTTSETPLVNDFATENDNAEKGQENFNMSTEEPEESDPKNIDVNTSASAAETPLFRKESPEITVEGQETNHSLTDQPEDNSQIPDDVADSMKHANFKVEDTGIEMEDPSASEMFKVGGKKEGQAKIDAEAACQENDNNRESNNENNEQEDKEGNAQEKEDKEEHNDQVQDDKEGKESEHGEQEDEPLVIEACWPDICYHYLPWCKGKNDTFWTSWSKVRLSTGTFYEHKYYQWFLLVWIVISSLALIVEDKYMEDRPLLRDSIKYLDLTFELVFLFETLIAWFYFGFKTYFTSPWHLLDFVIHLLSVISLIEALVGGGNLYFRSLRALRPLRLLYRIKILRVLVNSLVEAIPGIINVILVCFILYLIFSIMGVALFAGKFSACLDHEDNKFDHNDVPNRTVCEFLNYTWENSKINFDHIGNGFLALFQVGTFSGWIDIMNNAIDSPEEVDLQPVKERSVYKCLYFIFIIIFGSFFVLNLFTSTIIGTFAERKYLSSASLELFMTVDQKRYYDALIKMGKRKPKKAIPIPKWKFQRIIFDITTNRKFGITIMICVGVNLLLMALDHYNIDPVFNETLECINIVFVAIYTIECLMKLIALRHYYFKDIWNVFDFVVVGLSIADIVVKEFRDDDFVSPVVLRSIKGVRLLKISRLVKGTKGIRTLLSTLLKSLPPLAHTWFLHFIIMFVYAIFGMHFFKHLKYDGPLDDTFNFSTFYQSMILLLQLSRAAGWDEILDIFMDEDNCENSSFVTESEPNCANSSVNILYLVSFLIITFLIIVNMYIAVVIDKFNKAIGEFFESLTDDDYDMFFEIWQTYDPDATHYIGLNDLSDFLEDLEIPLQIKKPNKVKIVIMNINIYKEDKVYCMDVIDAAVLDYFRRRGYEPYEDDVEEYFKGTTDGFGNERISSTFRRQREEYCARVIQRAWRRCRSKGQDIVVEEYYNTLLDDVSSGVAVDSPR